MTKIFINAGHSKDAIPDAGCVYNDIKEAIICNELCTMLSAKLITQGFETIVYQQEGSNLTSNQQLNKVPQKANESKADIFISIHMNASTNTSAKGTETFYHASSSKGKNLAELINNELTKSFDSYTLSNRGTKVDTNNLLVLRSTNMPAVLTEIGFISNAKEAEFIKTHLDDIADRLVYAICSYFNVKVTLTKEAQKMSIIIQSSENQFYDCYVNDVIKLKNNKLETILSWIKSSYT